MKKDPQNCPFCEAEEKGISSSWGMSSEGWEEMKKKHEKYHLEKCFTCGQPKIKTPKRQKKNRSKK